MDEETVTLPRLDEAAERPRRRWWVAFVLALALVAAATVVVSQQSPRSIPVLKELLPAEEVAAPDTDGDGLLDEVEAAGWIGPNEEIYRTDPALADTDGDGMEDGVEADSSTDPLHADSDGDGLGDLDEVEVFGTDPWVTDTDNDGLDDELEVRTAEADGLDPLVPDVKISKWVYAQDFAIGMFAGEAWTKDSLAWLAGNLSGSASSGIPGIGWVTGLVADGRDTIASLIKGDWVAAGFSATGVLPYAGDAVAVPAKVGAYVTRHPEAAVAVAAIAASLPKVSDDLRFAAVAKASPGADEVVALGSSKRTVIRLAKGRNNLGNLADAAKGPGHVAGHASPFMADGKAGERELEAWLKQNGTVTTQAQHSTSGCIKVCNATARRFDAVIDGVAHEAKVGYTSLTDRVRRQIESDAHLIATGVITEAHWHFMASNVTSKLGPTPELVKLLNEKNIKYTIHFPK